MDCFADFANGITVTVRKQVTKTSKGALIAMGIFGGLVAVLIVAMLIGYVPEDFRIGGGGFFFPLLTNICSIVFYRRHKVVRAATFPFCVIMVLSTLCAVIA